MSPEEISERNAEDFRLYGGKWPVLFTFSVNSMSGAGCHSVVHEFGSREAALIAARIRRDTPGRGSGTGDALPLFRHEQNELSSK